jgi:hypothetical protein
MREEKVGDHLRLLMILIPCGPKHSDLVSEEPAMVT